MQRVPNQRYAEAIAVGYEKIPNQIAQKLQNVEFFCGSDPVSAGLHTFNLSTDGRSYKETAHTCWPIHISRPLAERVTTIVLPVIPRIRTVIHELGHAFQEELSIADRDLPNCKGISWYGDTDPAEGWAEAFTTWLLPDSGGNLDALHASPVIHLFEKLSIGGF